MTFLFSCKKEKCCNIVRNKKGTISGKWIAGLRDFLIPLSQRNQAIKSLKFRNTWSLAMLTLDM